MDITLERYHGLGNDYLVYDPNKNELELNEENVKMLCKADGSPYLESERKHCGKEWKRCADFCQIFERCRICTEEALYNADRWRRGRNHLPE